MTKTFFVFILTITLVCGYCRTAQAQAASKDETAGKARKKVLFLAGGRSHRTGEHEHRAGCIILANALNKSGLGFQTEVVSKWPKDMSSFDGVDAVVVYADAGGRYKEDQLKLLDEKVKAGMGIMFIHYGVHPSKKVGEKYFMPWIGGFFQTGISVNPHWTADLTPKKVHGLLSADPGEVFAGTGQHLQQPVERKRRRSFRLHGHVDVVPRCEGLGPRHRLYGGALPSQLGGGRFSKDGPQRHRLDRPGRGA